MIELAVLDIAGTTIEEHGSVYVALEQAVRAAGATPARTDIEAWMGADKHEAITALLGSSGRTDEVYADFRARLDRLYAENPPVPLPGVPEALAALRASGTKVVLTTGFDRDVTDALLASVGWDKDVLDAVVCVDDVPAGRPAPYMIFRAMEAAGVRDVRRVLTAGDTARDLEAGTNAGARFVIGVLTGSQDAAVLGTAPHTHLLAGVADIPGFLTAQAA
ncbi:phosphonoacetaldehyde hydrolase [Acrocarpospora phusangensis]|uniref:Phosphonoacetaldehyde hydrolase n=1 Tax=Acrocarpospora phusangensis TaxID=1070424 RepID=A0A919UPT9_9ACTN|nr:phosphonatase-like hydrolase [Acrocarpospora phusangensis]GIH23945.1 phosphonoacetaldehyde hydrolase [Acrocarpospora phusangensis]